MNTPIFSVHVAERDNTFGFIIELVDGKSSTNGMVLAEYFTLSVAFDFMRFCTTGKRWTYIFDWNRFGLIHLP